MTIHQIKRNAFTLGIAVFLCLTLISSVTCKKAPAKRSIEGLNPQGFNPAGSPESYNTENLFSYMNGEAEVYFPFGFQFLSVHTYRKQGDDVQMVVEAYDMETAKGARGIFQEYTRRKGSNLQGLGESAWTDNNIILFFRGQHFLRISPDPYHDATKEPTSPDLLELSLAVDRVLK